MPGGGRNSKIEALRIFAMFLVLTCHFTIHINWGLLAAPEWKRSVAYVVVHAGQVGVSLFFIITSWFMVRKPFNRVLLFKVWSQVLVYSLGVLAIATVFWLVCNPGCLRDPFSQSHVIFTLRRTILPILFNEYWFMTAYVVLLLLAPFLNIVLKRASRQALLALTVGLVLVSGLLVLGAVQSFPFSKITYAITCYIIGGYCSVYRDTLAHFTVRRTVAVVVCCAVLDVLFNYCAMNQTASSLVELFGWRTQLHGGVKLLQIVVAVAVFACVVARGERTPSVNRQINILASGTFGVYLLHEHYLGYRLLWALVGKIVPEPEGLMFKAVVGLALVCVIYALLIALSLGIDRFLVKPLQRVILHRGVTDFSARLSPRLK